MGRTLAGIIDIDELNAIFTDLQELPKAIDMVGKQILKYESERFDLRKRINEAKSNLATAEANAIAFPDPDRELKNEAQRRAYITEATKAERKIVVDLENKLLELESRYLDTKGQYDATQRRYDALKHRAELVSNLLRYYASGAVSA